MATFIYQLFYFLGALLALPLLPILFWQGKKVRTTIPKLEEPNDLQGKVEGVVTDSSLQLLTLGESTIAGIGVDTHQEGLTGHLAKFLCQSSKRTVEWQVLAKSGYTASDVADSLVSQIPTTKKFDLIVIGLGGNDTFSLNSPLRWKRDFEHLLQSIHQKQPEVPILLANMPPIADFPAFPPMMRWFLGSLVMLLGKTIRIFPKKYPNVYYDYQPIYFRDWQNRTVEASSIDDFFSDGVHPSGLTYKLWAKQIVESYKRLIIKVG